MLIANLGNMAISQLLYMMACCFLVKTLVSLVAVWPATLFLCFMKKDNLAVNKYNDFNFFQKIIFSVRDFSKPTFRLDKIDLDSKKASIYCRGARIVIEQKISEIILNPRIIHNMDPTHSSYLDYYFGLLNDTQDNEINFLLRKSGKSKFYLNFLKEKFTIMSITREGEINYCTSDNDEFYTRKPEEIYQNENLLSKFDSSHACYIGILVGLEQKKSDKRTTTKLKLIYSNEMS